MKHVAGFANSAGKSHDRRRIIACTVPEIGCDRDRTDQHQGGEHGKLRSSRSKWSRRGRKTRGFERPQPLRASRSQNNPVNCCFLNKPELFWTKLSDKQRCDLRVNEYTALDGQAIKRNRSNVSNRW